MRLDDLGALRVGMEGGRMAPSRENKHVKNLFGHGRGPLAVVVEEGGEIAFGCAATTSRPRSKCTATGRLLAKCRDLLA